MTTAASPEEVFAALSSTLVVDLATRRAAEAAVESLGARPGFAAALVQLTLAPTLALEIRQLAAVLLGVLRGGAIVQSSSDRAARRRRRPRRKWRPRGSA